MANDQKDNVEEDPPIGGDRLVKIELDEAVTPRRSAEAEHERDQRRRGEARTAPEDPQSEQEHAK